jgi:hypothetical protein
MEVQVANANIEHFKKLLETEMNGPKRNVLERLLAEETSKLAAALSRQNEKKED